MRIYSKRLISLLLAAEITASLMLPAGSAMAADLPLSGTPYTVGNSYDVTVPHVIINQVYGGGLSTDSAILLSHGFIELYNPTNSDIDLSGWSLQYTDRGSSAQTGPTLQWQKLDLSGTIKAHSSFLVKGASTGATSPKVNLSAKGDQSWERFINNKGLKVALMSNQIQLTDANPFETKPAGYVDMIGSGSNDNGSDIDGFETAYPTGPTEGTSKKKAIRRSDFADTDNNKIDFKQIDYEVAAGAALLAVSPRSGSDGAWGPGVVEPLTITTSTLPDGYTNSPYNAKLDAAGGVAPYSFTASGLPDGLSLASNGALTGTPTSAAAGASVTVTVTDSTAGTPITVDKSFTITINAEIAPANHVIINEVYGGGGKINKAVPPVASPYLYDFVELYNPTASPIALDGYHLRYSNKGATTVQGYDFEKNAIIAPHDYYLVRLEATWGNTSDKNYGEAYYADAYASTKEQSIGMSDTDGTVELFNGAYAASAVVDAVGFGAVQTSLHEGASAGNGTSLPAAIKGVRRINFQDSNNNAADFAVVDPSPTQSGKAEGTVDVIPGFVKLIGSLQKLAADTAVTIEGLVTTPAVKSDNSQTDSVRYIQSFTGAIAVEGLDPSIPVGAEVRVTGTAGLHEGEVRVKGNPQVTRLNNNVYSLNKEDTFDSSMHTVDKFSSITAEMYGRRVSTTSKVKVFDKAAGTIKLDNDMLLYINGAFPQVAAGDIVQATGALAVFGGEVRLTVASAASDLVIKPASAEFVDKLSISKIGEYSVGLSNKDGGVAEIVKFNKDNGKFYLVNGSGNPPSLDIVSLGNGTGTLTKEKTVLVKPLAETEGFAYGDLTSVDINTATKRVSVSVQEADSMKPGKILVLDYDGNLVATYTAGVQPDMIKSTPDGKYILTADEAEPRSGATDPKGSITIVNTVDKTVKLVYFDDPSVIEDGVHIRGPVDPADGKIKSRGTKADAVYDLEPEYISLSEDNKTAYVSLQENNAIAIIDIATGKVNAVKALGLKDYNDVHNSLDLQKDGAIKLENVPFKGMYMPDGIATHMINGQTYLFTANEGDVTEWPNRTNGSTIGALKGKLDPNSEAAKFLNGKTAYDGVEVASDMGNDGIYMYGGRSFSIWNASSMQQVYDSGNDFETITAARLPAYFNASNSNSTIDNRSGKKGPEPEDIKAGKVGNKIFAFVGLERIGGFMTYDVTDPAKATFANYTNTRVFKDGQGKDNLNTDTGPEGLEFIPANISPTGKPLLLVAYEVGGKVGVYQLEVTRVKVDKTALSLKVGDAAAKLTATVEPVGESAATATWSSSNANVATVDAGGNVKAVAVGTAVITALSADGYGSAETVVTVARADVGGGETPPPSPTPKPTPTPGAPATSIENGDTVKAVTVLTSAMDNSGKTSATVTSKQLAATLAALDKAGNGKPAAVEFKIAAANADSATIRFEKETIAQLKSSSLQTLDLNVGLGVISFDKKSIGTLTAAAGNTELSVSVNKADKTKLSASNQAAVGSHPVYNIDVLAGNTAIHDLSGGNARISIPYVPQAGEDSHAIVIYYIADNGELIVVPNSVYDAQTGQVYFTVSHFSTYGVGYSHVDFRDTAASFAKDSIVYLSARNIIGGMGENKFAPKANMTRADFTLILARIAGVQLDSYKSTSFSDVKASDYYAASVEWASEKGITGGIGSGKFDPKANISREQMVAMIARFAEYMKYSLPAKTNGITFVDDSSISGFAKEAAAAVQQAGIINGKSYASKEGSYFAPKDFATREEAAKMLAKLVQLMA
ncbi:choice-of-anchor I family protein [Paenibacillus sp. FJAT-27812]|uniref:choice-of-anchor I family protein n=1 Tax=Paenibacillus sp. FJAT-27812 TaxID=1684143 RepID=UPI000AB07621|nr:choice-of-anchor I family protein [Paenibacillus sp. FJAT-27812]